MSSVLPAVPQLGSQYRNTMLSLTKGRSMGIGGRSMAVACKVQKYSRKGKLKEKNSCMPSNH